MHGDQGDSVFVAADNKDAIVKAMSCCFNAFVDNFGKLAFLLFFCSFRLS